MRRRSLAVCVRGIGVWSLAVAAILSSPAAFGQGYQILHSFSGADGFDLRDSALMRASDGNMYGTAIRGGAYDRGVIFRMDSSLNVLVMHSFMALADGAFPAGPLIESGGYFYGMTGNAALFRMDFLGNVTPLGALESSGCDDNGVLGIGLTAAYGSLYGASPCRPGELFRVDSGGTLTKLHTFGVAEGTRPNGELLLASDGYLYGVTAEGGDNGFGTVFRADKLGNVTNIHSFDVAGGNGPSIPWGRLVENSGELYGATLSGGPSHAGTAYRLDLAGNLTLLHAFAGPPGDGEEPRAGLARIGTNFYGTTDLGGQYNGGTVYQTDFFGNTSIVHDFGDSGDGQRPNAPLLADGSVLYGTNGPGFSTGTIYILTFKPIMIKLKKTAGPVRVAPGDPVEIDGLLFTVGGRVPALTFGGLPATDVVVENPETLDLLTPVDLASGSLNDVTLTMEDGTVSTLPRAWLADFLDVPTEDPNHDDIERVFRARLMAGCGQGNFCQGGTVDRATLVTMALKAKHGPAWAPPACTGEFRDVACPGPEADWVEDAVAEGIAQPCSRNRFCPDKELTRETLPEILLLTEHGSAYVPPSCTGTFKDVPCPGPDADAIEQVYREGIVEACSSNGKRYCPDKAVDRGPMAEYAAKAFRLP